MLSDIYGVPSNGSMQTVLIGIYGPEQGLDRFQSLLVPNHITLKDIFPPDFSKKSLRLIKITVKSQQEGRRCLYSVFGS